MSPIISKTVEPEVLIEKVETYSADKIGLFGGSFNPPHIGHLIIAEQVRDQLGLEKIHFLPSYSPPHSNGKTTIDYKYRIDMLKQTLQDDKAFELNLTEINRRGKSYTYDTIKELKEDNPDTEYYFIIGADMVEDLPNWYKIDELVTMVHFVAVNRPGYTLNTPYPVIILDVPNIDISSSLIRHKVNEATSIKYLVTPDVKTYIENEGLYKDGQ
ncbi:nicotinate-nucleotide adenylyltransferase [Alkalibacterium sp.]